MEKTLFEIIKELWSQFDVWARYFIEGALVLILLSIAVKYGWPLIKHLLEKKNKNSLNKKEQLKNHQIFSRFEYWNTTKIYSLQFGDVRRNALFRKMLAIKFDIIKEKTIDLVSKEDLEKMSMQEFESYVMNNLSTMIRLYNKSFKEEFSKDIYEYVIDGEKGFNQWHIQTITYSQSLIQSICNSSIYDNNVEKLWAILNTHQSALDATLLSVEKTFKSFNGALDKIFEKES